MRRLLIPGLLILLLTAACVSPQFIFPDIPVLGGRMRVGGTGRLPPMPPPQPTPCTQISRIPCDFLHCGGPGFDFVTSQCQGKGAAGRCVPNGGCSVGKKDPK